MSLLPLLIVVSGLWFRSSLVGVMAALVTVAYGGLWLDSLLWRPEHAVELPAHVLFLIGVVFFAIVTRQQAARIEALGQFCELRGGGRDSEAAGEESSRRST